jgi:membrane associated rhomboid family serine protease
VIIPLGNDRANRRPTVVNHALIALNLVVFVALFLLAHASPGSNVASGRGPIPEAFADQLTLLWKPSQPWRFLTYAFLHGSWMHLLGNMLFLFVFGPSIEDRLGRLAYLAFYLLGAAAAGAAHLAFNKAPLIGASGAIAAVTGAFLVFFPRTNVRLFVFFIMVGTFDIPALWFIAVAILRDFIGLGASDNISRLAHLGGYAFGIAVALILLATKIIPRESFDLFSIFQRRRRLAEIRDAAIQFDAKGPRTRTRTTKAPPTQEPPIPDDIATARADIASRLARGDHAGAASAYLALLAAAETTPRFATLSKHNHLAVSNQLFANRNHADAAKAYALFLDAYPKDEQTPHVRLMIGLLHVRYLNNPSTARELLSTALPELRDPDDQALARQLLAELNSPSSSHP